MLTENLSTFKQVLKEALASEGIGPAISSLKEKLPKESLKFNTVLAIEGRLNDANLKKLRGILSNDQLQQEYNMLRHDLMTLIDSLQVEDFSPEAAAAAAKKAKTGHVLYRIPPKMELGQETRCIVRLAFEETTIIQNIELVDVTMKEVRISEAMEVELLDPHGGENFEVRSPSSTEQFIERGDFTEWLFYVKPKKEGKYPLLLKVTVLEIVNNKERKKEIVLEELVVIVAEPVQEEAEAKFCNAGWELTVADSLPWQNEPAKSGGIMAMVRRYSMIVAFMLVALIGAWAMDLPQEFRWQMAKLENTSESYQEYIERYPEGRHVKKAVERKDFRQAVETGSDSLIVEFLVKHPQSKFLPEAKQLFVKVSPLNLDSILQVKTPQLRTEIPQKEPEVSILTDEVPGNISVVPSVPSEEESAPPPVRLPEKKPTEKEVVKPSVSEPAPPPAEIPDHLAWLEKNMVKIDGGTFEMGCKEDRDGDCYVGEKPLHKVQVSTFYLCRFEVTQALWKAVMDGENPSLFRGCDMCPVEQVSCNDVQEFIKKLNKLTGKTYRLPTEAEWEFAARGGKKSKGYQNAGSNVLGEVAWYYDNAGRKTHPVGQKKANELGLFDMSGNVWEWCQDWYGDYFSETQSNPQGPAKGSLRVLRGGSWAGGPAYLRCAVRDFYGPDVRLYSIGFRLAMSAH